MIPFTNLLKKWGATMTKITKASYPIEVEKIKAINPHIVVNNNVENPYYSICYYDIAKKDWYTGGFGSYDLKDVVEWLNECFEVVEADVEPVKHGEWVNNDNELKFYKCSICGNEAYWDTDYGQQLFDFCPWCGAKMDGKEVQE